MSRRSPRAILIMGADLSKEEAKRLNRLYRIAKFDFNAYAYLPVKCCEKHPLPNGKKDPRRYPPNECLRLDGHKGPHVAYEWDDDTGKRCVYSTWTWVDGDLYVDEGL
jgi:hypothetical protein